MRRSILLAGLALAGCELYSVPSPAECPGTKVGRFDLALRYAADAGISLPGCPSFTVASSTFALPATLTFQADGGAAVCLDRSHAVPFYGAHAGDHVLVSNVDPAAPVNNCGCLVVVVNEIEGDVVRDADGGFVGFTTSRWLSTLSPPDGGAGYPPTQDGGVCGCGLPCQVLYTPDGGP